MAQKQTSRPPRRGWLINGTRGPAGATAFHLETASLRVCANSQVPITSSGHTDEERERRVTRSLFFPDVSAYRILAVLLENCLLPGKPIGLPITLEWIGPA